MFLFSLSVCSLSLSRLLTQEVSLSNLFPILWSPFHLVSLWSCPSRTSFILCSLEGMTLIPSASWDQFPGCCWRGWWLMMERRTITRAPLAMVLESSSFFPFVKPMVVLFRFYTWMPFLSYDLCFSLLLSQQKWKKKWGELNCSPPSKNHQALCPRPDIDLGTCLFYFFLFCFFVSSPLCFDIFNSTWWWCEHLLQIRSHIPCRCSLYVLYLNLFRLHCRLWWDKVLHSKVFITTAIIIIIILK